MPDLTHSEAATHLRHVSDLFCTPAIKQAALMGAEALEKNCPSTIPCCRCGGPVVEFAVPNDIWNAVIRRGGPETDQEYLCMDCWYDGLRDHIKCNRKEQTT